MEIWKFRCDVATDDAIRQRVTGIIVEVCSIHVCCVPGDGGTDPSRQIEATRTKKGGRQVVSVQGLFRKIRQSDLAMVERIGDNILHIAELEA